MATAAATPAARHAGRFHRRRGSATAPRATRRGTGRAKARNRWTGTVTPAAPRTTAMAVTASQATSTPRVAAEALYGQLALPRRPPSVCTLREVGGAVYQGPQSP